MSVNDQNIDEEYTDYLVALEQQWLESKPKEPTPEEWVKMYPELKTTFRRLYLKTLENKERLEDRIRFCLSFLTDSTWDQIQEGLLEITAGKRLETLEKRIQFFKRALYQEPKKPGVITDADIQQANAFPIIDLLPTPTYRHLRNCYRCPFHADKTPSFHVYSKTNSWFCFGCQQGGDAIKFVMQSQKLTFPDAVSFLNGGAR